MKNIAPEKLALRPLEAAKALGISPRHLWQLTNDGIVPCVKLGSGKRPVVLYPVKELNTWLSKLAGPAPSEGAAN